VQTGLTQEKRKGEEEGKRVFFSLLKGFIKT
jgi:hypothetical protein